MKLLRPIALAISILLYPMLMPTYAMLLFSKACLTNPLLEIEASSVNLRFFAFLIFGTLLFTCLIPFSIILLMIKQGKLRNAYIEDRDARRVPYLYSIAATIFWCYFLWRIVHLPSFVVLMALGATMALGAVTIINHWWKISAHLSCMGALIGSVVGWSWHFGVFSLWFIPTLFFVALLLMYSRLYLNAHTPLQLISGLLLGMILTFVPSLL